MYPTISDLLLDLFGVNIPLPIQSFGFMLAISFLLAAYTLQRELKRKEQQGLINTFTLKTVVGKPISFLDLLYSFTTGFLVGFKLFYIATNYSEFVNDTQGVLLSTKGNLLGGIAFGALMAFLRYREVEKEKLPEVKTVEQVMHPYQLVGNLTLVAAISGIIGAKIFHNLENLDELSRDPIGALLSFSGLTMYGGLILGTFSVMWYGRKHGIKPLVLADATAPGLMLAYGTGRLGCQISGDGDWGVINPNVKPDWLNWLPDWAWAYNYPNNVINAGIPIPGCEGAHCMMLPDAVYPTPLYEAFVCIVLFFVLWSVRKHFDTPGKLFSLYLLFNGFERFLIELVRVNNKIHFLGITATQAEIIAVVLMALGATGLLLFKKSKMQNQPV
jgi:phosphatidylglycerol---prolipoprotein diacylglyceryl transferase